MQDIGLGALFLSSKLEESPIRLRDLINAYDYLLALSAHCSTLPYPSPSTFVYTPMEYFSTSFYDTKDALVVAEMQILKRLGFQAQVASPYGVLVNYLRVLELAAREDVVKKCWGYVNDLFVLPILLIFSELTPIFDSTDSKLLSQLCILIQRWLARPYTSRVVHYHHNSLFPSSLFHGGLTSMLQRKKF